MKVNLGLLKSDGYKSFFLEGLEVDYTRVVHILVLLIAFASACLAIIILQEYIPIIVHLPFKINVVRFSELLIIKAFDDMVIDEFDYLFGVKESDSTNIDQMLDMKNIIRPNPRILFASLVCLGILLFEALILDLLVLAVL